MQGLPVREIVLYKHGVGFFRREGQTSDNEVVLTFREDEINDVLKSLAVFDHAGGQIQGIHYQTPMDRQARLADSSIRLSDNASLFDLIRSLRGRDVELLLGDNSVEGRMIGLDREQEKQVERSLVSIITDEGIQVFPFKQLTGIRLRDDRAEHDLHYFLDTMLREGEGVRRSVSVRLSEGDHDLSIYYVAPAPTWRVSYRFVAESGEADGSGDALLQGWGIFDNRLDEDLEDVQVTLVAGQPISFIYSLYESKIPQRPIVEDESRGAPGPVEFAARPMIKREKMRARRSPNRDEDAVGGTGMMLAAAQSARLSKRDISADMPEMESLASSTAVSAQGEESGAFFRYAVTNPVTVKRGESALVPIIGSRLGYEKELLYNGQKFADHPVAAIRYSNDTGLTLERGPVTLIEDGEYIGEAVVPFTKPGNDVYLPYAVELGVRVTEHSEQRREIAELHIRDAYIHLSEYHVNKVIYSLENTTDRDLSVIIEAPVINNYTLFDTTSPITETVKERRWKVDIPAKETATFIRQERMLRRRRETILQLDYRKLQNFMADKLLDQSTFDALTGLLDDIALKQRAQSEIEGLKANRSEIYERQRQLRENMTALQPDGEEGVLRTRLLRQLEGTEDQLGQIDEQINNLIQQIAEVEERIRQILSELETA